MVRRCRNLPSTKLCPIYIKNLETRKSFTISVCCLSNLCQIISQLSSFKARFPYFSFSDFTTNDYNCKIQYTLFFNNFRCKNPEKKNILKIKISSFRLPVVPTFLEESLSSSRRPPTSRPWALASLLPCTRLPTITDAGPTSETQSLAETQRKTTCCSITQAKALHMLVTTVIRVGE